MDAEQVEPTYPSDDMTGIVGFLAELTAHVPTLIDGERWARFDVNGSRVMFAGPDTGGDAPTLAVKVNDLDATATRLREAGFEVGEPAAHQHERRAVIHPGAAFTWSVVLYEPAG